MLAVWLLLPFACKNIDSDNIKNKIAISLAILMIVFDLSDDLIRLKLGTWNYTKDLPIHLCGFSIFLGALMLINKNQFIFELVYFWGLGGALQAILTPDVTTFHTPWHAFSSQVSHGLIILSVSWMIIVERKRCLKGSLLRAILITNIMMFFAGIFNFFMDSNYFFLCAKPNTVSPFLMGEWPYYILSMEIFGILMITILYIPMKYFIKQTDTI